MAKKKEQPVVAVVLRHAQRFNRKRYPAGRYTPENAGFIAVLKGVKQHAALLDAGHATLEREPDKEVK